ncbi:acyl-CoA-binding domain-containing protein 4 isoform X1 [Carettochelys insculpta]|uniref:acyl-CoA-binding domain-containing protein 4 isoform X1 n=1 Tax=Carettochelys insculpta TaxID=44489 RepID=UPI003EBAFDCE
MEPGCQRQFRAAAGVIQALPRGGSYRPPYEVMLRFYSYYKQATVGSCEIPRPGFWDPIGRYKWDAWNRLGKMSREEAMAAYVSELKKIAQEVIDTTPAGETSEDVFAFFQPLYEVIHDMPRPPESFFKKAGRELGQADRALESSQEPDGAQSKVCGDTLEQTESGQPDQCVVGLSLCLSSSHPPCPDPGPAPDTRQQGEPGERTETGTRVRIHPWAAAGLAWHAEAVGLAPGAHPALPAALALPRPLAAVALAAQDKVTAAASGSAPAGAPQGFCSQQPGKEKNPAAIPGEQWLCPRLGRCLGRTDQPSSVARGAWPQPLLSAFGARLHPAQPPPPETPFTARGLWAGLRAACRVLPTRARASCSATARGSHQAPH